LQSNTRSLLYFPIIHAPADLGALREPVQRISMGKLGKDNWQRNVELVEQLWRAIQDSVASADLDYHKVRIYQDGLPHCGRELQIVADLAKAGSRNHQLLLQLTEQGATLMGSEAPDLLLEEYQLMMEIFASGDLEDATRKEAEQKELRKSLLQRRDQYIAERINLTLGRQETGILFLGLLHAITSFLDADIRVTYPPYTMARGQVS
jgi:hypothetical protein